MTIIYHSEKPKKIELVKFKELFHVKNQIYQAQKYGIKIHIYDMCYIILNNFFLLPFFGKNFEFDFSSLYFELYYFLMKTQIIPNHSSICLIFWFKMCRIFCGFLFGSGNSKSLMWDTVEWGYSGKFLD